MRGLSLTAITLLLITSAIFTGCSKEQAEVEPLIRPVRYTQVFATGGSRVRTFSGIAQAGVESKLSFKVHGTVDEIHVQVGDKVNRNQLLIRLDSQDYNLQLQEAEASLAQAMAGERNAKSKYERTQAMWENRNASKNDLETSRASYESASAQVESLEKRLEMAKLQVEYCKMKAPISGLIAEVTVEVNENVPAGKAVVTLTSGGLPEVKVTVPEVIISQVRIGSQANVVFSAIPDVEFNANVTEVGVSSTSYSSTFPVTVKLNESNEAIRPGMAAEVSFRIETAETRECIYVPIVAVGEDKDGRYVFTLDPADEGFGIAKRRSIEIGELTEEGLEVTEGLSEGELVVTAGVTRITDGQKVKLY